MNPYVVFQEEEHSHAFASSTFTRHSIIKHSLVRRQHWISKCTSPHTQYIYIYVCNGLKGRFRPYRLSNITTNRNRIQDMKLHNYDLRNCTQLRDTRSGRSKLAKPHIGRLKLPRKTGVNNPEGQTLFVLRVLVLMDGELMVLVITQP